MPLTSSRQKYLRFFGYITVAAPVIWAIQDLFETARDNKREIWRLEWRLKKHDEALERIRNA